jgi:VWFA-related protein
VVEVDVIARDRDGRFASDLRAEDFELLEDGTPRELSTLYRVVGAGEASSGSAGSSADAAPQPPPQQADRIIVFFFDQAHTQPGGFERARQAALAFLPANFRQGDVGGVLAGGRMLNDRLTSSREELQAALQSLQPAPDGAELHRALRTWPRFTTLDEAWRVARSDRGSNPGPTALDDVAVRACREQAGSCSGPGGRAMVESEVRGKAEQIVSQARVLARQTLETLSTLASGLARLPGRKTVIMLTDGFFVEESWADLRRVLGLAARASVRIYAVDTRGLDRGSASSDIIGASAPSQPELAASALSDADGANSLAVDSGGLAIRNQNDLRTAFEEIDRDTSSYYILGFRTTTPPDGKYHAIQVRVKRNGITARARRGYVASPSANATLKPNPSPDQSPSSSSNTSASPSPGATNLQPRPGLDSSKSLRDVPAAGAAVRARPRVDEGVASLEAAGASATGVLPQTSKATVDGWKAYQRGDVKSARDILRPAAADSAMPQWARYVLGWAEYATAGYVESTGQWERVRAAVPEFEGVYFDLADGYLQQKEFGKAIAVLREAQKRWPKDVEVYNAIGVLQAGRGALNDAIKTFEEAVSVGPSDATACYNLAKSLELRYVQAERLRKASQSAPSRLVDRERALEYYRRTVELGGPNVDAAKEGLRRLDVR